MLAVIVLVLIFLFFISYFIPPCRETGKEEPEVSRTGAGMSFLHPVNDMCPQFWATLIHLPRFQQLHYMCVCISLCVCMYIGKEF